MKKKWISIFNIVLIIFVLGIIFLSDYYRTYRVKKNALYSVGKITGVKNAGRGGTDLKFEFEYLGKKYDGRILSTFTKSEQLKLINRSFIVVFDSTKPSWNSIYIENEIKDSMDIPKKGWKVKPIIK